jgi:hypothetical protein
MLNDPLIPGVSLGWQGELRIFQPNTALGIHSVRIGT